MVSKEEFDWQLTEAGGSPEVFWQERKHQGRYDDEDLLAKAVTAGQVVDRGLTWAGSGQGDDFWRRIKQKMDHTPPKPFVTCCIWNGHPLYCRCDKK